MQSSILTSFRHLTLSNSATASAIAVKNLRVAAAPSTGFETCALSSSLGSFDSLPQRQNHQLQSRNYNSNRSKRGLYDGKDIRSGNNVSFSMKKTKRKFKPNVFKKRIYSEILDEMIPFHLTTSALRSIDKAGGLDNYLLKSKHVKEGEGMLHKRRILQKMAALEKNGVNVLSSITVKGSTSAADGDGEDNVDITAAKVEA